MIFLKQINYLNEIGRRENIEDCIFPASGEALTSDRLFLVCDGVGGESKGEIASHIACEEFSSFFRSTPPSEDEALTTDYLKEAQAHVLRKMSLYAHAHPGAEKMSTTLTLVYVSQNKVLAAWCGDSRIYHLRDGKVKWRSTDHSLVGKLIEQGELTEEEALKHPQKNIILRSLSASGKASEIDSVWITDIREGDNLFLCTDGVLEQIDDQRLSAILTNPKADKSSLFLEYCLGNTSDNFSFYLLQLGTSVEEVILNPALETIESPVSKKKRSPLILILVLLIIVLLGVLGYFFATGRISDPQAAPAKPKAAAKPVIKTKPDTGDTNSNLVVPNLTEHNTATKTKKNK